MIVHLISRLLVKSVKEKSGWVLSARIQQTAQGTKRPAIIYVHSRMTLVVEMYAYETVQGW
jgi:hypothetical protein